MLYSDNGTIPFQLSSSDLLAQIPLYPRTVSSAVSFISIGTSLDLKIEASISLKNVRGRFIFGCGDLVLKQIFLNDYLKKFY